MSRTHVYLSKTAAEIVEAKDAEIARLRAALAEAQGSAKLNGLMCDLGFSNMDTWRDETLRLRAERDEVNRERLEACTAAIVLRRKLAEAERERDTERASHDEASRMFRILNGMDIDDWDKRAEYLMRTVLDGLHIGETNRLMVKGVIAEHFADIGARADLAAARQGVPEQAASVVTAKAYIVKCEADLAAAHGIVKHLIGVLGCCSQSSHISGSMYDTEWLQDRNAALGEARAFLDRTEELGP